ncbi:MAG TPA: hypothetical protein VGD81_12640 [Opitutaceae bacterium]
MPQTTIQLIEIAFARSGDKGDGANVAVFGRTPAAYAWLREHLTARRVEEFFRPLGIGPVTRYDVPNLEALNFLLPHILAGGGSRSLRIDAQGKTLGMALLEMKVEVPHALIARTH